MAEALTAEQQSAIDPRVSVWVSANAGTGKTKVLVSRVLRLMLEGVAPSRILCLTFTNAAAAEMTTRVKRELAVWATLPEVELGDVLALLLGSIPGVQHMQRARSLFLQLVDRPEALRIETIHALCQSLLRRFPLEAGVPPHFSLMDSKSSEEMLGEAWRQLLAGNDNTMLAHLATELGDTTLSELVQIIIAERKSFERLLLKHTPERLGAEARRQLGVADGADDSAIIKKYISSYNNIIKDISNVLGEKWKCFHELQRWLAASEAEKVRMHEEHQCTFLTQKNEPAKTLLTKDLKERYPEAEDTIRRIQDALITVVAQRNALYTARMTETMLHLAHALFALYDEAKSRRAQLDYDDLILLAHDLLKRTDILPWVMFRLDGGIDHVLVDEAQDTSAEQWEIIAALCGEFYTGEGAGTTDRTLFAVGDFKQSIFSFQGANPTLFHAMRHEFGGRAAAAGKGFRSVPLKRSFRSVPAILEAVDAVFRQSELAEAIGSKGDAVQHIASEKKALQPGRVEVWPLVEKAPQEKTDNWELPLRYVKRKDQARTLAENIAEKIQGWLAAGRLLPSRGTAVTPGDIMVLVRRRGPLVEHINRALAERGIPVAGVDRMLLTGHIAVQDLLALGNFLLLPEDDLTLATVLKSPLAGISEEALFALAHGRGKGSLWERAENRFLSALLSRVDYDSPLELYTYVLEVAGGRKAFTRRFGPQVNDVLDEFLNLAAQYSQSHTPSLQGFLHWVNAGKTEIKRDLEHGGNEVRVMTVHAAKGLQAPIVFLPDCGVEPQPRTPRLLWLENGVIFNPKSEKRPALCGGMLHTLRTGRQAESMRLLYVAMTRAEDELYICGHEPSRANSEASWHDVVSQGLRPIAVENDGVLRICHPERAEGVDGAQAIPGDASAADKSLSLRMTLPPALLTTAIEERTAVHTPSGHLPAAALRQSDEAARQRGNFLHLLLQHLPDSAPEKRAAMLHSFAGKHLPEATSDERASLLQEAEWVLAHPDFAPLFSSNSRAEVPVTGTIGGRTMHGQIDRLAVVGTEVFIIDYKTSRQPPVEVRDVPAAYIRQLADYRALVQEVYPGYSVRCVLLWTSAPRWMELPTEVMAN